MNYFQGLSLALGLLILLRGPALRPLRAAAQHAGPRLRTALAVLLIGALLLLVLYTWYQHYTSGIAYSGVVAILFTVNLLKLLFLATDRTLFRRFAGRLLEGPWRWDAPNVLANALGLVFVMLGLLLY